MMSDRKFWQWIWEKNRIKKRYEQERFPLILLNAVRVQRVLNFWQPLKFRVNEYFYRIDVSNGQKELSGRKSVLSEFVISKDNSAGTLPVKAPALIQDYPLTVIPFKEFRELKTLTISQYLSGSIIKTEAFPSRNRVQLTEKHVKLTNVLAMKTMLTPQVSNSDGFIMIKKFEMNVLRSIGLPRSARAEFLQEDIINAISFHSHKVFLSDSPVVHEKSLDYRMAKGISQQPEIIHAPAVNINKLNTEEIAQVSAVNNIIASPKESAIDISRLADQVYQAIEKKIRWEKERRGV